MSATQSEPVNELASYSNLKEALAHHIVDCNRNAVQQLLECDEVDEYNKVAANFANFGTDYDTGLIIIDNILVEALEMAKELQSHFNLEQIEVS